MLRTKFASFLPFRAPEDGSGSGAPDAGAAGEGAAADAGGKAPENVLFPDEGKGGEDGDKKPGAPAGDDKGAADWKEYAPDPNKSEDENARLKAEHDKTKPADKKADDPGDKVPEDGKYDLKMPDGVELDAELASALGPEFKDLGLTNAQAQKLVDKYIAARQARMVKEGEASKEAWERGSKWPDELRKDQPAIENANRFIRQFNRDTGSDEEMRAFLATPITVVGKDGKPETGFIGNYSLVRNLLAKAGAMIKEDNPASGGAEGAGKPAEAAHILFPNDAPKGS